MNRYWYFWGAESLSQWLSPYLGSPHQSSSSLALCDWQKGSCFWKCLVAADEQDLHSRALHQPHSHNHYFHFLSILDSPAPAKETHPFSIARIYAVQSRPMLSARSWLLVLQMLSDISSLGEHAAILSNSISLQITTVQDSLSRACMLHFFPFIQ